MSQLAEQINMLVRQLADSEKLLNELDSIRSERDDYLRQLQLFWRAEKRPWFCPICQVDNKEAHKGYLQPMGRDGLQCRHCSTLYRPVDP